MIPHKCQDGDCPPDERSRQSTISPFRLGKTGLRPLLPSCWPASQPACHSCFAKGDNPAWFRICFRRPSLVRVPDLRALRSDRQRRSRSGERGTPEPITRWLMGPEGRDWREKGLPCKRSDKPLQTRQIRCMRAHRPQRAPPARANALHEPREHRHLVVRASSRSKGALVSFGVWESPKEDRSIHSVISRNPRAGDVWTIRRSTKTSFLSIQT